jgi:hypothetical protein
VGGGFGLHPLGFTPVLASVATRAGGRDLLSGSGVAGHSGWRRGGEGTEKEAKRSRGIRVGWAKETQVGLR